MASHHKRFKTDEHASCSTNQMEASAENFYFHTSDFSEIVKSPGFVDKTLLLKQLLFCGRRMILITAPHRFGKSTNMDMVKKFFEIQVDEIGEPINKEVSSNYKIFKDNNLLIFQDRIFFEENFATYPVIYADFKRVVGSTFHVILDKFRSALHMSFKQHPYLLQSDKLSSSLKAKFGIYYNDTYNKNVTEHEIVFGFRLLSECLYRHFRKVFVLIDEYDAAINDAMFAEGANTGIVNNLLCLICTTLKRNYYVEWTLLMGNSYFASVGLCGVINIENCMFLGDHPFVPYYGLTEDEVTKLLSKFEIDNETKEKITLHYDGFRSLNGKKMFSIWSILHFLEKKIIDDYWEDSAVIIKLREAMNYPVVRCSIEKFCIGMSVEIDILEKIGVYHFIELQRMCSQEVGQKTTAILKPDVYLNFLLQQGYLTIEKQVRGQLYAVRPPNAEILGRLRKTLLKQHRRYIHKFLYRKLCH